MKKIFFLLISLFVSCVLYAQKMNSNQQKLKTDIFNFLKKEVSNISDYSVNELKFAYNGTTYFVAISETDISPMYVTLYAGFNMPKEYDKEIVAKASTSINLYKGVKCYSGDDFIKFQSEMFMNDYKTFAVAFRPLINVMGTMRDKFDDAYEKAKLTCNTSSNFISQFKTNSNEFAFPAFNSTNDDKLYITKVKLDSNYTILEMTSYNMHDGNSYGWASINKNSYIVVNSKKYILQKAEGIAYAPQHTNYPSQNSSLSFKLYFPPIPKNCESMDFFESSNNGWQIYGISLDASNITNVSNAMVETSVHKWQVVSVQCQKNQTIIKKMVTPKEAGTWINSSQEEFIEDADTGRKYYLIKSDIGFESNRTTIYDTKSRIFNEVYPALPSYVKRINISSGSQYYVKNLKIR